MIGIVTMYRIDPSVAIKQLIWFTLGVVAYVLVVVVLPDLKSFSKYKYVYLAGVIVFMAMATLIGVEKFGSKNWVQFGPISFQPSEIGKLFLVAYLSSALKDYNGSVKSLIEPALIVMYSLGFMVIQKDLGSALIFFGISVTMLYLSTNKLKYIVTTFILAGVGATLSYKLFDHVRVRVAIWLDPWADAYNKGLQIVQGLFAMASGGLLGAGLGKGYPGFIPVNTSDFIFAVICEEMGLLMGFGIMILFFLMFYRSMRAAIYVEDKFFSNDGSRICSYVCNASSCNNRRSYERNSSYRCSFTFRKLRRKFNAYKFLCTWNNTKDFRGGLVCKRI